MAVPNTDDFSLQDVCDEMNNNGESGINTLPECFGASNDSGFNTTYKGSKDRLSNFRAYSHAPAYDSILLSNAGNETYACEDWHNNYRSTFYIPSGQALWNATDFALYSNGTGNPPTGYYSDGMNVRYWNNGTWGFTNTCGFSCLIEGTEVLTVDNQPTLIEDLKVGYGLVSAHIKDLNDSNDLSKLYKWKSKELYVRLDKSYITNIEKSEGNETICINHGVIEATGEHTQLVYRNSNWIFIPVKDIRIGDKLSTIEGKVITVNSLITKANKTVYKLTLSSPYHTFYANGVLTHNIKGPF